MSEKDYYPRPTTQDPRLRIGILGGSFDPVHNGHISLAKSAIRKLKLDHIIFIPAKISPFKSNRPPIPARHRLKMLELAIAKISKAEICEIELKSRGPSYTVRTLEKIHRQHPKADLFFIMGSDVLKEFYQWKNWQKILKLCTLAVGQRRLPAASTEIRDSIKKGSKKSLPVPKEVLHYIRRNGLYL